MERKLQKLTEKIYQEGVEKAEKKAAEILENAENEAAEILKKTQKEAKDIRQKAHNDAEEKKMNVDAELKLAAQQSVNSLKQKITHLISTGLMADNLENNFKDNSFLKSILETIIKNWTPDKTGNLELTVLLPPQKEEELRNYLTQKLASTLNTGITVSYDNKLKDGFRIGPGDGSYIISFTNEDFTNFFGEYLSPKVKKLLFDA